MAPRDTRVFHLHPSHIQVCVQEVQASKHQHYYKNIQINMSGLIGYILCFKCPKSIRNDKKVTLGTSDTWSMSHLCWQTRVLYCRQLDLWSGRIGITICIATDLLLLPSCTLIEILQTTSCRQQFIQTWQQTFSMKHGRKYRVRGNHVPSHPIWSDVRNNFVKIY